MELEKSHQSVLAESLRADIEPFINPNYKTVALAPFSDSGWAGRDNENPWLLTAVLMALLRRADSEGASAERVLVDLIPFIKECEIEPGLYHRYPRWDSRHFSHDELLGQLYILKGTPRAKQILQYGQTHDWCWNNIAPGQFEFRSWLFRFLHVPAAIYDSAGEKVPLYAQIMWALGMVTSALTEIGETSGKQISILQREQFLNTESKIMKLGITIFEGISKRRYGDDWATRIMSIFYAQPNHPARKLAYLVL